MYLAHFVKIIPIIILNFIYVIYAQLINTKCEKCKCQMTGIHIMKTRSCFVRKRNYK